MPEYSHILSNSLSSLNAEYQEQSLGQLLAKQIDQDESRRLTDEIQNIIGRLPKLLAKMPQHWRFLGLTIAAIAPFVLEYIANAENGDYDNKSIINDMFNTVNFSNLFESLSSGLGLYALFNASKVYDTATQAKLVVNSGAHPAIIGLQRDNKRMTTELIGSRELALKQAATIETQANIIEKLSRPNANFISMPEFSESPLLPQQMSPSLLPLRNGKLRGLDSLIVNRRPIRDRDLIAPLDPRRSQKITDINISNSRYGNPDSSDDSDDSFSFERSEQDRLLSPARKTNSY